MDASQQCGPGVERSRSGSVDVFLIWLVHPVTVAATALLVLNDQVLKAAYPGWLTGKLSDVAGLVMAPPLLAVVLALLLAGCGRLPVLRRTVRVAGPGSGRASADLLAAGSVFLVGVGFTAVKATPEGAATASAAWSVVNGPSVILADGTDLLALPALGLAWWTWRSAAARPSLVRWLRMVAVLVVLPIAGLGVVATSAPVQDDAVTMYEWQGVTVVGIGNAYHGSREPYMWWIGADDGSTFSELPEGGYELFSAQPPPAASGEDCSARDADHCFRIVPGRLAVQESRDGGATWRVAWQIDDDARERLGATMPGMRDVQEYLSSRALLVREQPDGGVVVLVANGRDGFARRDSAGRWERIGFGTLAGDGFRHEELATPIPSVANATVTAGVRVAVPLSIAVGSMVALVGCATLLVRRHGWSLAAVAACVGALHPVGFAVFIMHTLSGRNESTFLGSFGIVLMTLGLMAVPAGLAVLVANLSEPLQPLVGRICAAGLLAGAVVSLPYLLRLLTGWPPYRATTTFALATAAVVMLVSGPAVIRYAIRRVPAGGTELAGASPWVHHDPPWPSVDEEQRTA
ncbi:hypothetical protein SAMN05443287_101217 [Micromonospora phaseoli]|uniref:Uncharacterized protein n=1 Tax=Micromonospora phaseoli TaxID=1144548 RepID=A0A1H6RF18_9ACTN|nr:hypothetical protein [Micromonospora phaseoli]PZW03473.1 hypothetical protein CLV64_101217 [Micromonospora phaseoli]GIJ77040.1 hypothetical protein Xph01_14720 [Micromonospora phaseoli]SEI54438.1 hypothetical protein SAMN05443287_101217 [Micromonospora phaseoli]